MAKLRISVVIPVFNEEEMIIPCLEALFAQAVPADEIIVVDNNSTDGTRAILEQYKDKIRILNEPRPGVVFARTTGFDAAKGDIIGRIDADSRVTVHWVATLHQIFARHTTVATTGGIHYYDLPAWSNKIDRRLRPVAAVEKENAFFLHGANMAFRKEAWDKVRPQLCLKTGVHEDLDIAIHLRQQGKSIFFAPRLVASVSARRLDDTVRDFNDYIISNLRTYEKHNVKRKRGMILVVWLFIIFHLPLRAIRRGYDISKRRVSIRRMFFARPAARKNPIY